MAAAALLLSSSLTAADAQSVPTSDAVSIPVSIEPDTHSTPSLNLNFDTFLEREDALQPLTGLNSEESRRSEPEFLLRLDEQTLFQLQRQQLDELGLYLLADPLLVPESDPRDRQRRRWYLLERQAQLNQLTNEIAGAFEKAQGAAGGHPAARQPTS